jgi:hypothetical protein
MLATRMMMSGKPRGQVLYGTAGSYSFTVPAGVTEIRVTMIGGGGGGGGNASFNPGGGGGSGLGLRVTKTVTPGDSVSATVGAAGFSNGANGDPGGNSSVTHSAATAIAGGGDGGTGSGTGGAGATFYASGAWSFVAFSDGTNGAGASGSNGGNGGNRSSFYGYSGTGATGGIAPSTPAVVGSGYGAGGGGAYSGQTTNWVPGSYGTDGMVLIEWGY